MTRRVRAQSLTGSVVVLLLARPAWAQIDLDADSAAPALPGPADTLLPRTGVDSNLSDLREHLLSAYGDNQPFHAPPGPSLMITGQFGASEEFTTDAGLVEGGGRNRGSDFITALQPGITIVDTSQRLQVNLNYQPVGEIYARNTSFSQFQQQFNGDILATALPGWLFVDVRGSVSQQAVFGGLGPASTVTLSPDNRQTFSSVSASPYITRSLGGAGTVQAGVGYVYSSSDSPIQAGQGNAPGGLGAYGSSYLATKRAFASYTTGENLGRLRNAVGTDDNFYDGAGALAGGRRILVTDDASYALTRLVTLLAELGYEDLAYPRSDFFYSGPVGSGGVRLNPNRASSLTLEYRYIDGYGSLYVQGSEQLSPRIRVFGGYSSGVSTFQQDEQDTLLDGAEGATGVAASALQAAPLLSGSNAFGANQNLNLTHRLDATVTFIGDYDTGTLSIQRETTKPIGREIGGFAPVRTDGLFVNASEIHQLTPTLSLTAFAQYGHNRTGLNENIAGINSGDTVSVSVGVNQTFSATWTGYITVGGTFVVGGSSFAASGYQGLNSNNATVVVGGVKRF